MQRKLFFTYFLIVITLLVMMSISRHSTEKMRGESVSLLAPIWEKFLSFKHFVYHPTQPSLFTSYSSEENLKRLELENQLLETDINDLKQLLQEQLSLSSQITLVASSTNENALHLISDHQKAIQKNIEVLNWRLKAIPARVIFRSFDTWNNALWINVGEIHNQSSSTPQVSINSPVVVGRAIVGAIDYVGKYYSRVMLITDRRLNPSVRTARNGQQDFLMYEKIENLLQLIQHKKQLPISKDEKKQLLNLLNQLQTSLQPFRKTWYLAKGELLGSYYPSRFGQHIYLKGTGFNYDFADEEGDSRDLRTGKPIHHLQEATIPILKEQDLLVTTGLDGVFPAGFQVARVVEIESLKEGDYFFNLKAQPIAAPFEELSLVFVLPAIYQEELKKTKF